VPAPERASRAWRVALAACVALACAATAAFAAANPAARFVLTQSDVGKGYRLNANASGPRALSDVTLADTSKVVSEIKHNWLGGEETAYNGISVPWGIVSLADVFRSGAAANEILPAWVKDAVKISAGVRIVVPLASGAPGSQGALVRGQLAGYETLIYMWRHGRTIASVDVTGKPGTVPVALAIAFARRQDSQITTG
jgi:hypothetical protein